MTKPNMPDKLNPSDKSVVVNVDAATLLLIVALLIALPLIFTGFFAS